MDYGMDSGILCTVDNTILHCVLASFSLSLSTLSDLRRFSFVAAKTTSCLQNVLVETY